MVVGFACNHFLFLQQIMLRTLPILLVFVALATSLPGQTDTLNQLDEQGRKTGYWIMRYPSGNIRYEGRFIDGKPVGELIRYYPDQTIKARLLSRDDGRYLGQLYDETGRMRASGHYMEEKKDGQWVYFSRDSQPVISVSYEADRLNGPARRYFVNGTLMEETQWINNKQHGVRRVYHESGQLVLECHYLNGQMHGAYRSYSDQGMLLISGQYENNLKTGVWKYFGLPGDKTYTINYVNGQAHPDSEMDSLSRKEFEIFERNRQILRDPLDYLSDPFSYIR